MILRDTMYDVLNIDALTYAGSRNNVKHAERNERYSFMHARIEDHESLMRGIEKYGKERICGTINCAAESHVDRSIQSARPFVDTNVTGTLSMLECHMKVGAKTFIQVSTDEVYGSLGDSGLFREDSPIMPNSPYSATKASADMLVRSFVETHSVDAIITRCSNNYGPMQHPEKLIPMVITKALNREKIPVYGDGMNVRDWIHVEDHCRGILLAFLSGSYGEVYNFGGSSEKTNLDVVRTILSCMEMEDDLIEHVEDRLGHDRRYAIDHKKASADLFWNPVIKFEDGIRDTVRWYMENKGWRS